jgi:hypothetical protein
MTDDATLAVLKSIQKTLAEHTVALGQVRAISVSAKLHGEMLSEIRQDIRDIRAAVSDMDRTRLSVGEADALHLDLSRLQEAVTALEVRVGVLEEDQVQL